MAILVKLETPHRHNGRTYKPGDKVNLPNSMALAMKKKGGCTFVSGPELVKTRAERKDMSVKKAEARKAAKGKAKAKGSGK